MSRARRRVSKLGRHGALHHKPHLRKADEGNSLFDVEEPVRPICQKCVDGRLNLAGGCEELYEQIEKWTQQSKEQVKHLQLYLKDHVLQRENRVCIVMVFLAGMLLCGLPWLVFLTSWFKIRYRCLFEVETRQYETLSKLIGLFPNLTKLVINLRDNTLDESKLKLLFDSCNSVDTFVMNNCRLLDVAEGQTARVAGFLRQARHDSSLSFIWQGINVEIGGKPRIEDTKNML